MAEGTANSDQARYWSSDPGRKWITNEADLDNVHATVLDHLLERASITPGERVLDIGCGTGASSLAAARLAGAAGRVVATDISAPLLERTRQRIVAEGIENAEVLLADAQTYEFAPGSFDVLISRFGVMFFSDPVAAFANMARALRASGRMVFACWGPLADNPWFHIPGRIASERLGAKLPPPAPGATSPTAFGDRERVVSMMKEAGLTGIRAEAEDLPLRPRGTVDEIAALACRVGSAVRAMNALGATAEDAAAIRARLAEEFSRFTEPGGLSIPARINFYSARP